VDETEQPQALQFFKALADESRLKMAGLLASREFSVEELATALSLKPPTVSHHLGILRRANLVRMRPDGTTRYYRLDLDTLRRMHDGVRPENIATRNTGAADATWDEKVRGEFFEGLRLKKIPASRKKRDVILNWLAGQFEIGMRYPEKTVNEIIKRHHEDTATLRRELVGGGWMERQSGVYWRTNAMHAPTNAPPPAHAPGEPAVAWRIANRASADVSG
jgi:hypothetical protein